MSNQIIFGSAGLGGVKEAEGVLEDFSRRGIKSCEIAFTYGVYIKDEADAKRIGAKAKELGIRLSIHSSYFVNLNSVEKEKLEATKKRILDCMKAGTLLGVDVVVFHPGYYGKLSKEESYENIKNAIKDLQRICKEKKYTPLLAPETMGKINVFGSLDEILKLVEETGCSACIDFAHIYARNIGKIDYVEVVKKLEKSKLKDDFVHVHFSGIEYGDKGEKKHKATPDEELKKLISAMKNSSIKKWNVINESPEMIEDSIKGIKFCEKL